MSLLQDKKKEVEFFDSFGDGREYNVFTDSSNQRLMRQVIELMDLEPESLVADLGCGSGIFIQFLKRAGHEAIGLDISSRIMRGGLRRFPDLLFVAGDVEQLPFASCCLQGALLIGIVHHFPDPRRLASEVFRVLKPGARFVAFDPNRRNPFMNLYRNKISPFYDSKGVTENERPILAEEISQSFTEAGFRVQTDYLSGMQYRYVASSVMRLFLPIYNLLDSALFLPKFMAPYRSFVLTWGAKP